MSKLFNEEHKSKIFTVSKDVNNGVLEFDSEGYAELGECPEAKQNELASVLSAQVIQSELEATDGAKTDIVDNKQPSPYSHPKNKKR
jgi:hypothetical protein